jgi:hypothetical protein
MEEQYFFKGGGSLKRDLRENVIAIHFVSEYFAMQNYI